MVILTLAMLGYGGVIALSDVSSALAYGLVCSFFGILLWGFAPRIRRFVKGKTDENVTMPVPSQEAVGREKRPRFWTIMIIMAIGGSILIALGLSLPFPVPISANWVLYYAKVFLIGGGIAILLVFTVFTTIELYLGWESRKKRMITCLKLFKDFDDAFNVVQEVSAPELKMDMLRRLRSKLVPLCNSCSWKEAKDRVGKVLEFMPEKLSSESSLYLQFLTIIIQSYGEIVVEIISKKWLKEIQNLYDDTQSNFSLIDVLYILQELHGYDYSFMEKLIDDATLYWSEFRFDMLADHIGFAELKKRNPSAHELILKYLLRKLEDATKGKEDEIKKRLRFLYNKAVM